ncbi:hypothetical protein J6590_069158 [Homalodisca vitripennis]|nr:hypothetical protein J6590_069158 [Homalodisca vitripennis]
MGYGGWRYDRVFKISRAQRKYLYRSLAIKNRRKEGSWHPLDRLLLRRGVGSILKELTSPCHAKEEEYTAYHKESKGKDGRSTKTPCGWYSRTPQRVKELLWEMKVKILVECPIVVSCDSNRC